MENSENSGTGSCEKIGFANFASDLKCSPTTQTLFIGDSEQKFARLNSRQIREIDFFTASCPQVSPGFYRSPGAPGAELVSWFRNSVVPPILVGGHLSAIMVRGKSHPCPS